MQVEKILQDNKALVCEGNTKLDVDTSLLEEVKVGDYVIVHAGFAIEVLENEDAEERLQMFQALSETKDVS
jgi:hydrogenase expression/formation protein HypC